MYEKIAELCDARKITVSQLAKETGISQSVFANMKRREGVLSFPNAIKVAKYFGVSVEELASK